MIVLYPSRTRDSAWSAGQLQLHISPPSHHPTPILLLLQPVQHRGVPRQRLGASVRSEHLAGSRRDGHIPVELDGRNSVQLLRDDANHLGRERHILHRVCDM